MHFFGGEIVLINWQKKKKKKNNLQIDSDGLVI